MNWITNATRAIGREIFFLLFLLYDSLHRPCFFFHYTLLMLSLQVHTQTTHPAQNLSFLFFFDIFLSFFLNFIYLNFKIHIKIELHTVIETENSVNSLEKKLQIKKKL